MPTKLEEICRRSFDAYLASKSSTVTTKWLPGTNPPDYFLFIRTVKYAVEATTLMEQVKLPSTQYPIATIIDSLTRLVRDVENEALKQDILAGTYVVTSAAPIANLPKHRNQIEQDLLTYIRLTRALASAAREVVFDQPRKRISIQKLSGSTSKVREVIAPGVKWEDSIEQEACSLLQDALLKKARKLSHIRFPLVLLLWDEYQLPNPELYKTQIQSMQSVGEFHTIFLVQGENKGCILYNSEFGDFKLRGAFFMDSCAFDPKYCPEDTAAVKLSRLHGLGVIDLQNAYSTMDEIQHPSTPAPVKEQAANMIYTKEVGRSPEETRRLRDIAKVLAGKGKVENVTRDASHVFESQKYGRGFVTADERIVKKRKALQNLKGMHIRIYKPSELLQFIYEQFELHKNRVENRTGPGGS